MKQSMQGTAATTDESNVMKHAGAKLGRPDELFRKLGHSGKSLRENVFFILAPRFRVSVSIYVFTLHALLFHIV